MSQYDLKNVESFLRGMSPQTALRVLACIEAPRYPPSLEAELPPGTTLMHAHYEEHLKQFDQLSLWEKANVCYGMIQLVERAAAKQGRFYAILARVEDGDFTQAEAEDRWKQELEKKP